MTTELVLPSGRFCAIRKITWLDRINADDPNIYRMLILLACATVTIDGRAPLVDELCSMGLEEAQPIMTAIGKQLTDGFNSKAVA
jgi:hypothetical protein